MIARPKLVPHPDIVIAIDFGFLKINRWIVHRGIPEEGIFNSHSKYPNANLISCRPGMSIGPSFRPLDGAED